MNQNSWNEEREIDLIKLLWDALEQWKPILCVGLICACLVSGVMYLRSARSYQAVTAEQEASIEDIRESLTEEELASVEYAVAIADSLKERKEYQENSILLSLDANNVWTLSAQYYISSEDDGIVGLYENRLMSEAFLNDLKNAMGLPSDVEGKKYVRELVTFDDGMPVASLGAVSAYVYHPMDTSVLDVYIMMPQGTDADAVGSLLDEYVLHTIYSELEGTVPHSIQKVGASESYVVRKEIVDTRYQLAGLVTSMESTLDGATNDFTSAQTLLYEDLTAERYAVESVEDDLADDTADGVDANTAVASQAEAEDDEAISAPHFSKKYFAIGFLVGIVLYGGIMLLLEIFKKTISTSGEVETIYGIRTLEEMHTIREFQGWKKFIYSEFVRKLRYKKEGTDYDARMERVRADVAELCDHRGYKEPAAYVYVGDGVANAPGVSAAGSDEILRKLLSEDASDTSPIVFVIRLGVSKFDELQEMLQHAIDFDRPVVGAVFVEE